MIQYHKVRQFYDRLLAQSGKSHNLQTTCEQICNNLALRFSVTRAVIALAYGNQWKIILNMDEQGTQYHYPPIPYLEIPSLPAELINLAITQQWPVFHPHNAGQWLLLPLERQSENIGCMLIDFPESADNQHLQSHDFHFLAALLAAELNASMFDSIFLSKFSKERVAEREMKIRQNEQHTLQRQLQALHDISFKLWRADSIDSMLFTAVDEAKQRLNIDRMAIFLFQASNRMKGTYGTDLQGNTVNESNFESDIPDMWFTPHALGQKEYLVVEQNTPLYHDLKQVGFGWSAYISLWDEDTLIGWIACDNLLRGLPLPDHFHQLLKQFGFIVSQHLVRRQAEEKLRKLNGELEQRIAERTHALQRANTKLQKVSREDPLTEVANRRVFDERFIDEWRRADRHQLPLSILIIDIDYFKEYNDSFGHAAGDECLKTIAQTLAQVERRAGALFARYGGEEFVLLLPGQDNRATHYAADKALNAIRRLRLARDPHPEQTTEFVTISIGGATITPSTRYTPDAFFKMADSALYEAKSGGRNQRLIVDILS
ncbi:sensor domain-containing diguanylate cyclase [Photobacterium gaetbulicola]|uniref:diguanylate cyclase n=1 Tax=Photobacterium gaetbulicola Gung47 TaxID=658445 RepID=A0A0C5WLJ7_9GAMM|nr:GGDEF domain-containing protein [Photobacterium gaetbulicola]AJR08038.1 hypothetical protein H744_2c1360 [Photobacterium gaetbulicola Gung47]PSU07742.1 sensor domain-containing diguanylate cyclase [Photobacterium gaetbulicola]